MRRVTQRGNGTDVPSNKTGEKSKITSKLMIDTETPWLFDLPPTLPEYDPNLSESCDAGDLAEARFMLKAKELGFHVYAPFGHATKADLVVWKPPARAVTVQIKKATIQSRGSRKPHHWWKFMLGSGRPSAALSPNNGKLKYVPYQLGDFDVIAGYVEEREEWLIFPLEKVVGKSCVSYTPHNSIVPNTWEVLDQKFSEYA